MDRCGEVHPNGTKCRLYGIHVDHVGKFEGELLTWPNRLFRPPSSKAPSLEVLASQIPPKMSSIPLPDPHGLLSKTPVKGLRDRPVVMSGTQRAKILTAFATHPDGLTAEEAGDLAGVDHRSGPWNRCSEMVRWQWLVPTKKTRQTVRGANAQVYAITAEGARQARGL